jgi:methyl-accepting chemotaxis protein
VAGVVVVTLLFALLSSIGLNLLTIKGPYYRRIVQGKDLIADVLPPPEYIIESYLVTLRMLDSKDPAELRSLIDKGKRLRTEYEQRHAYWQTDLHHPALREALLDKSYPPAVEFFDVRDKEFVPAILAGDRARAVALAHGVLQEKYQQHRSAIDEVVTLSTKRLQADEQSAGVILVTCRILSGILVVVMVSVVLLFRWYLTNRVTKPLSETAEILESIAKGDLRQRLNVRGAEEIECLVRAANKAFDAVNDTLRTFDRNSRALKRSSGELTSISEQMGTSAGETLAQANIVSAAAEQVSINVQTVATGIEEMSASIREIAQNAGEAARVATSAVQVAETTNGTVAKLGDSSAEIGNVVKVITRIAEQTNLLALNATIEAARAGEAGKGFAVVANEVKELAEETARATEEIGQKITLIQTDTGRAVEAIGQITEIIHQINDFQNTIASAVEEQTATANEISRNVLEASAGASEIAGSITDVVQYAQSTAEGAGTTRSATVELARMAEELERFVRQFQFDQKQANEQEHADGFFRGTGVECRTWAVDGEPSSQLAAASTR